MNAYLRQFEAIWRLDPRGRWSAIYHGDEAASPAIEQIAELFASLCVERLARGVEVTGRAGAQLWIARRDGQGVLVGVHREAANPLMVRAVMRRLEETVTGADAHQGATTSLRGALPQAPPAPRWEPPAQVEPPRREPLAAEAPRLSYSARMHRSQRGAEGWPGVEARSARGVSAPEPFVVADALGAIELDEWAAPPAAPEPPVGGPTWGEASRYIQRTVEAASAYIGERVALNYWRQAVLASAELSPFLRVDPRGRLELAVSEDAPLVRGQDALSVAYSMWLGRCRRVIPDLATIIGSLGEPPWHRAAQVR